MDGIFLVAWSLTVLLVPVKEWRRLWPAGIVGLVLLFLIDTFLINLDAFRYRTDNTLLYEQFGLPLFYWASSFPGALLLVYYYPKSQRLKFPYVLLTAGLFLALELIMEWLGYFHPIQWSSVIAYLLDIGGFIVVIWLSRWFLDFSKV